MDKVDTLVAAWLPGSEGRCVANVLIGDYGFTGKLARTWFKSVDELTIILDQPQHPLRPHKKSSMMSFRSNLT